MKTIHAVAVISMFFASMLAHAGEPSVSVTVSGEITPGVYGEVQIGNAPPPLVYVQPMIISPRPHHTEERPVYLHVPPGHAKHWARHCREYNACNRPVYFVRSAEYEPGYRDHRDGMRGNGRREASRDEGRKGGRGDEGRGDEGDRDEGRGRGRENNNRRGEGRD